MPQKVTYALKTARHLQETTKQILADLPDAASEFILAMLCCAHGYHAYTLPVYGLCISFHCCVRHELSVEEAHQLTVRLEKELRERLPLLGRILIHLEPPRTESAPLGK